MTLAGQHSAPSRQSPEERPEGMLGATADAIRSRPRGGPAWLAPLRAESVVWLETRGFPSPRDEAWRFTPLRSVLRIPYEATHPTSDANAELPASTFSWRGDVPRIVLDGGRPASDFSTSGGITAIGLARALATEPDRIEPYLGRIAKLKDGFVAQNTALFEDGIVLIARGGAGPQAIHLVHVARAEAAPTLSTPRVLVIAEPGSELTLVESHESAGNAPGAETSVTEIAIGDGARVEHVRIQRAGQATASLATIAVRQGRDSRYASHVFTFGGALSRVDLEVTLAAEGAECVLSGLYLAGGGDVVDHHTTIEHAAPRCSSRESYRGIVDGDGVAVFDGTIVVRRGAARTEAHQENRNLLLSANAVVHAKPHLEIDTDDVKCSHGATVGRLDPAQLFYLRARGLDAALARSLLTYAFARAQTEALGLRDESLRTALEDAIAARLPGGSAVRELA